MSKAPEEVLSTIVGAMTKRYLKLKPTNDLMLPGPEPGKRYMLYMHVPFCERLCPYCSFNRFPFREDRAKPYFANLRREMLMLKDLGHDFDSVYIGGGTPTIMIDELCETIDLARESFSIREVSSETNPNHLIPEYLEKLKGRVQRLSVGVQSFDNGLLAQMDRLEKYGAGEEILERIGLAAPYFTSMNVDMIFNFPAQTEDILLRDLEAVVKSGSTQTTFYPLMASPVVQKQMAATVGAVDYAREKRFYEIIDGVLAGGDDPLYTHSSCWTFNKRRRSAETAERADSAASPGTPSEASAAASRNGVRVGLASTPADAPGKPSLTDYANLEVEEASESDMIDEYVVNYEEYPAIGSGGITYLGNSLFVNTFSVPEYNAAIDAGHMSIMGKTSFSKRDRMRYRFMMQLFGLRLDKRAFERDFGVSIDAGLPIEMTFMRAFGAFENDDDDELTLTPYGRYLLVVMMRQFFIGVNRLRDQARAALPPEERELLFGC